MAPSAGLLTEGINLSCSPAIKPSKKENATDSGKMATASMESDVNSAMQA